MIGGTQRHTLLESSREQAMRGITDQLACCMVIHASDNVGTGWDGQQAVGGQYNPIVSLR